MQHLPDHPYYKYGIVMLTLFTLFHLPCMLEAQNTRSGDQAKFNGETRIYQTVRIQSAKPKIDGVLDDACWDEGVWAGDYRQQLPAEGAAPSQKTGLKILYDSENIYVAIKAYDNEPERIDRQMARRDQFAGDIVGVNFDSYFDHRTGFEFDLTAAGSKIDLILLNDNSFDTNWNPVWDGKVGHMDSGWTAEMQIPLSQLRYGKQEAQIWGLHSWRWLNRNREEDQWNLIPRDNAGPIYNFGELHGLRNLPTVKRVEFLPYALAKAKTYEEEEGNPFADGFDPSFSLGLDGKFGIGSNLTVDYTINPDFGQVEADPSELNLTAFETYFDEKRPFFIEGSNIFDLEYDDNQLFYSRRIGHEPTYDPEVDADEYVHKPENTSILGALKLTGKTQKGLSVGIMENLTALENANISSPEGDYEMAVEPLTNYFVGRVQQDINQSNTIIGAMVTSTYRNITQDYLSHMNKSALTGGLDFRHYLVNKTYYIDFKATGSQINGSTEAITALQQESSRYYQRPDAPHLKLDTTSTQLSGTGGSLEFIKGANGKWRFGIGAHWTSPGMELNDMGFQNMADKFMEGQMIGYVENTPRGMFRSYEIGVSQVNYWNFGGEYLQSEWEFETEFMFKNKWNLHAEVDRTGRELDVALLRGGPGVYVHGETSQDYFMNTDESRKISMALGYENDLSDDNLSKRHEFHTELTWKVINPLRISPEFTFNKNINDYQFIPNEEMETQGRYLLGRLNRKTYEFTLRIDYAITPDFTIQYYGSPYITMGSYSDFKTLSDADSKNPDAVFRSFTSAELTYDPESRTYYLYDGVNPEPELSFPNPDFNYRQFRSNLVARWEYRPGSVLYLVWTQSRTSFEEITNDDLGDNFSSLFSQHPENIFLIKFSYWFSL
jgi:hypothetical protein